MYIDELQFICNEKKILREVKYAPTNLAASMCKLTFKHNLTHFVTLMKDTSIVYPFQGRKTSWLKLIRWTYRVYS